MFEIDLSQPRFCLCLFSQNSLGSIPCLEMFILFIFSWFNPYSHLLFSLFMLAICLFYHNIFSFARLFLNLVYICIMLRNTVWKVKICQWFSIVVRKIIEFFFLWDINPFSASVIIVPVTLKKLLMEIYVSLPTITARRCLQDEEYSLMDSWDQ